jgi:hypothetical protein
VTATGTPPAERHGAAIGLATAGWLLFAIAGPVALFLTWWGDCLSESCPIPSDFERTVYLFDLVSWLAFPAIAFVAYRGMRLGSVALVLIGLAIIAQAVAALSGARAFHAFAVVLPSGALVGLGGLLGLQLRTTSAATRIGSRLARKRTRRRPE